MAPLVLRLLPLDELKPAPYNPRRAVAASSPAYRKLKTSLEEFGLVEPLIWNETTGHVVGGHLRLRILEELGVDEVSVSVVRLSPAREKALNVVLNNQEAQGRYERTKLAELLAELELGDLTSTGFDEATLRQLQLEPLDDLPDLEGDPDAVELTIVTTAATYTNFAPRLDELVREFDLETHVKRGA